MGTQFQYLYVSSLQIHSSIHSFIHIIKHDHTHIPIVDIIESSLIWTSCTACFLWVRPYVLDPKAQIPVKEQRKVKTFLYTQVPFPYLKIRLEVVKKEQVY
jgi:hypothetical protein